MKRYHCNKCGNRYKKNQTIIYKDRIVCPFCKGDLESQEILTRRQGVRK